MTETHTPGEQTTRRRTRRPRVARRTRGHTELYRHPSDVARLVFSSLLVCALLVLGRFGGEAVLNIALDIIALFDSLPDALEDGLVGLVQMLSTVVPVVAAAFLIWRREYQLFLVLLLAAILAAIATTLLAGVIEESVPLEDLGFDSVNSWFIGGHFPSTSYLAALTAVLVAASPWLARGWRWAGWTLIAALVVSRIVTATSVPLRVGLMLAVGAAAGSLALIVFGAPRRRIDPDSVATSLDLAGVPVDSIEPVESGSPDPMFVATTDGEPMRVKVLGRDQRDADLLLRMWTALTIKGLGDDRFRRSPAGAIRNEALALSLFGGAGAKVPAPITVVDTPDEAAIGVRTVVPGRPLADCAPNEVSNAALVDLFTQVDALQKRRYAHRSLDSHNVLIDGDVVRLVGLRRSTLHATDEILGADLAELLTTVSMCIGIDRTIWVAESVLDESTFERAVPMIQEAVFSRRTREQAHGNDELLNELRDRLADSAGIEHVSVAEVQRITVKGVVSLVGSAVLVFYLLSLASDWDQIWDAFRQADSWYVLPIFALSMSTYLSGALSLMGAVPIRLPFGRTTTVMFGQSFLNRFTPANAGGMAMRVRYLQLSGLDGAVSATSIGLTSGASGVAQVVMIVLFLFWGGASDRFSDFEMPNFGTIFLIVLIVGLIVSIILVTTWGRRVIVPKLREIGTKIGTMLNEIGRDPKKLSLLFGGALLAKLANIVAFYLSAAAFGVDISFPKAGALYIIATTIGSAVPTPGGVGGVEAALTAALVSFGVDNATAAAIVLFFRILTFWLPTIPGYAFLQYTQRKGIV